MSAYLHICRNAKVLKASAPGVPRSRVTRKQREQPPPAASRGPHFRKLRGLVVKQTFLPQRLETKATLGKSVCREPGPPAMEPLAILPRPRSETRGGRAGGMRTADRCSCVPSPGSSGEPPAWPPCRPRSPTSVTWLARRVPRMRTHWEQLCELGRCWPLPRPLPRAGTCASWAQGTVCRMEGADLWCSLHTATSSPLSCPASCCPLPPGCRDLVRRGTSLRPLNPPLSFKPQLPLRLDTSPDPYRPHYHWPPPHDRCPRPSHRPGRLRGLSPDGATRAPC